MANSSIWALDEFKLYEDVWKARQQEFAKREAYYTGEVYERHKYRFGWVMAQRLYRGIRPLFLPFARAVQVDAGIVPGGWTWKEDAPEAWRKARAQVFAWSEWQTRGVLYVHYGAIYGNSALKVVDARDAGRVVVVPVNPQKLLVVQSSTYDPTPAISFYVEKRTEANGDEYEYAEVITPDSVRTFKNGLLFGFGGREAEYANALGFVPYVEVPHVESGEMIGECTFQPAMRILDELNELGSYLSDLIKKHAEPQWLASGIDDASELKKGDNVWTAPEGAKIEPILAQINIEDVRAFIQDLARNVSAALPETAFDDLREKDKIATATLELQLQELVYKVQRVRPNYDAGLIKALRMAGRAAKDMGLSEIAALDDEALTFDPRRPVVRADLDVREKIDYLIRTGAPASAVWELMGVEREKVQAWQTELDAQRTQFNNALDSAGETAL